ncbi:Stress responsive A/B Barrel Domain protein [Roseimaritima multifibrata]|uniref:Stress responsive A/B Barrel Domain protein n=1 Tax=Roseimaritima multifibrata TaxID=1930274 RepID=A0A517MCU9_9BACT|nr:Dabb family protein [Roseimaritima multifibrata]QDS92723.1 Stress responsive A/B Barrel Domain protein [Roseimaritima multifibrata]
MAGLAHYVFFTLHDSSPEAIDALVNDCNHYLDGHDGCTSFLVGRRTPDLLRPVNDQTFHVSLQVTYESREAHDVYQTHPRHLEFIEKNKPTWAQVRVFDSNL